MIKEGSHEMGADFYQLFTAMITNRRYEDVMDESKKSKMKARLGDKNDRKTQVEMQEFAQENHKKIVEVLGEIRSELLLVLKTNDYLRSIDRRLGNPNNTFSVINNVSWEVYSREVTKNMTQFQIMKQRMRFWFVKMGLFAMYVSLRVRIMFGMYYDPEALQDFDLDVVHSGEATPEVEQDSLLGLAIKTKKLK